MAEAYTHFKTLLLQTFRLGILHTNCYIVYDDITKEAFVVDPGHYSLAMDTFLEEQQINVSVILLTHAHFDHIFGIRHLKERYPTATVHLNGLDRWLYSQQPLMMRSFGVQYSIGDFWDDVDVLFSDNQHITVGGHEVVVYATPGHTEGSSCFLLQEYGWLFTGDTIFSDSHGRTDLVGGNITQLKFSVRRLDRSFTRDEKKEIRILPGHGVIAPLLDSINAAKGALKI